MTDDDQDLMDFSEDNSSEPEEPTDPAGQGNSWPFIYGGPSNSPTNNHNPSNNPQYYTLTLPFPIPSLSKEEVEETIMVEDIIGCYCKKCKGHFDLAEPNQEDRTFICWACRNGY